MPHHFLLVLELEEQPVQLPMQQYLRVRRGGASLLLFETTGLNRRADDEAAMFEVNEKTMEMIVRLLCESWIGLDRIKASSPGWETPSSSQPTTPFHRIQ